jgi:deoxyribonuclease-2
MEKLFFALKAPHDVSGITCTTQNSNWKYEENLDKWLQENIQFSGNASFILYNDEVPDEFEVDYSNSSTFAHSKGVLVWTETKLFWLIHSVPKWPCIVSNESKVDSWWSSFRTCICSPFKCCWPWSDSMEKTSSTLCDIPKGETKYGQNFVLLQIELTDDGLVESIIKQLLFMNVQMYHIQGDIQKEIDTLKKKVVPIARQSHLSVIEITPTLKHYAKSHSYHIDIYESLVKMTGVEQCMVESWMRPAMEESLTVRHIKLIEWSDGDKHKIHLKESCDHSKWALSKGIGNKWVFMGDMNRMTSQHKRGGGGLLVENCVELHKSFENLVVE